MEWKDLFWEDGIKKDLVISYGDGELKNSDIKEESISLEESICTEKSLRFGGCNASKLVFKTENTGVEYKEKKLTIYNVLNDDMENPYPLGEYSVVSDKLTSNRKHREIVAYDKMYEIINEEMTGWYNGLFFPMQIKKLRTLFFAHFGVVQQDITLPNDNIYVMKNDYASSVYGGDIIKDICEINGCFGRIGRTGIFEYVFLQGGAEQLDKSKYITEEHEDFITQHFDKLIISQSSSESDYYHGTGDNTYVLTTRILQFTSESTVVIATKLFDIIRQVVYVPVIVKSKGNPCLECGTRIKVITKDSEITSYILERRLTGIQSLRDELTAQGTENYKRKPGSKDRILQTINGKLTEIYKNNYYMYVWTNAAQIIIPNRDTGKIFDMKFATHKSSNVIFHLEATVDVDTEEVTSDESITFTDADLTVTYVINDVETSEYHPAETYMDGRHVLHLMYYMMVESDTMTHLVVRLKVSGGSVKIGKTNIKATIFGQGLIADQKNDGNISIEQSIRAMDITAVIDQISVAEVYGSVSITDQVPEPRDITEMIPMIALAGPGMVQLAGMTDTITVGGLEE